MAVDGAARRRRERRLRGHWKHECLSVRMAVAAALHHSSGERVGAAAEVAVQTEHAPVTEHVAPAPDVIMSPPSSAIEYVAPAPGRARKTRHFENVTSEHTVTYAVTSPVSGYVDPASDHTYAALAPVVGYVDLAPTDTYFGTSASDRPCSRASRYRCGTSDSDRACSRGLPAPMQHQCQ